MKGIADVIGSAHLAEVLKIREIPMIEVVRVLRMLALIALAAPVVSAQPADRCADILHAGVFDTAYLNAESKKYHLFQRSFCSASSESDKKSLAQNFSYLTPTESYVGSWNASSDEQRRNMFCDASLEETFTHDSLEQFIRQASPIIVDAWSSCMKQRAPIARFSARYSNDLVSVSLEADSGMQNLPLSFGGKTRWQDQIDILPPDALKCRRGFSSKDTRDVINCTRAKGRLNEVVQLKLLTEYGEQPMTELPSIAPVVKPPPPPPQENVYLNKELEIGKHTFQAVGYQKLAALNRGYAHGVLFASNDAVASVITYRIPHGMKSFATDVVSYQAACTGGGPINGWTVIISAPNQNVGVERSWNQIDPNTIEIPVDNIPYGMPREITITVNPHDHRTCDHSGLGDPHFKPASPSIMR